MDVLGNNRYELLFMDDDLAALPAQLCSAISNKKQRNCSASIRKPTAAGAKKNSNVEKENKAGALNSSCANIYKEPKDRLSENILNKRIECQTDKGASKLQNGEARQKRNVQRKFRECEQIDPRHFRDRENRAPTRNRGGKREFDRQSGSDKTGVKSIDKRDGAGAHNWGSVKQEIDDINKSTHDASLDKEESSNEQILEQLTSPEEEVKELTLDEWKALRGQRIKPHYNIRKPNEGEDISQWKKMLVLNKKKEGESEEEYEYDPSMYPQRVGRLQRIVDIQFNFSDSRSGRGFGRSRGSAYRPGLDGKDYRDEGVRLPRLQRNSGERQQKRSAPNSLFKVDDELQFPTLS